jgi:glycosyltransferase involved in cell wall biosynthesis
VKEVAIVFHATGGGVQRSQVALANALARAGLGVSVVMPRARGPFLAQLRSTVRIVDLATDSSLAFTLRLAKYLRTRRPDQLLVSQHHTAVFALVARRIAAPGIPAAVIIHNHFSQVLHNRACSPLLPSLMRWTYRWAERVGGVSAGVVDDLRSHLPRLASRLEVFPQLIALDEVDREGAIAPCGEPWLDDKDVPVCVSVGELSRQKDFETVVRAMALLSHDCACRLVLVGDGALHGSIERLVERLDLGDSVRLVGFQENPYKFMSKADVVVVSSRWEGFCLVVAEALALGVPVVSTDCPSGPAEILDGGRFGTLVPVGDASAMAAAVSDLISGRKAYPRAELQQRAQSYRPERGVSEYLRMFDHEPS